MAETDYLAPWKFKVSLITPSSNPNAHLVRFTHRNNKPLTIFKDKPFKDFAFTKSTETALNNPDLIQATNAFLPILGYNLRAPLPIDLVVNIFNNIAFPDWEIFERFIIPSWKGIHLNYDEIYTEREYAQDTNLWWKTKLAIKTPIALFNWLHHSYYKTVLPAHPDSRPAKAVAVLWNFEADRDILGRFYSAADMLDSLGLMESEQNQILEHLKAIAASHVSAKKTDKKKMAKAPDADIPVATKKKKASKKKEVDSRQTSF